MNALQVMWLLEARANHSFVVIIAIEEGEEEEVLVATKVKSRDIKCVQ